MRVVPVAQRLAAVLEMLRTDPEGNDLPPEAFVFGDEIGESISSVKTAWQATCDQAGIVDLHFHDLRREFACRLLESRAELHDVRDFLGHTNITTTSRYLRSTTLRLERALTLLEQHEQQQASSIDPKEGKKDSRSIATSLPRGASSASETDDPIDAEVVDVIGDDSVSRPYCSDPLQKLHQSASSIDALAKAFEASVTTTGSRYADSITTPCAFVLSHQGKVVHASRSKALRDARAIIPRHSELPSGSASARSRAGNGVTTGEIEAADWFDAWERGGMLLEESRHLGQWDQTLTLLWFESEEVPSPDTTRKARRWEFEGRETPDRKDEDDELGLKELDGQLRWPGRSRRRWRFGGTT